jgi:hypothetical protein
MPDDTIEFSSEQREELRVMLADAADVPVPRRAEYASGGYIEGTPVPFAWHPDDRLITAEQARRVRRTVPCRSRVDHRRDRHGPRRWLTPSPAS